MSFPRYPKYKESGVEWLGDVPEHWAIKPLWTFFRRVKRTGFEDDQLLSVYRDFGVIPKASRDDNFNKASEDLNAYQLVVPGDLAINKMKAWQGSVAISEHRGIVSPAYFVYQSLHSENSRYLHYLMRSPRYITGYLSVSKGIRVNQWDLEPQLHSRMPLLVPPDAEQTAIAAFLDRETAKIDALVAEQRRLIELLKEKRQAVISHAVTKGLNPDAKLKPSGIEWLGDVPEHWSMSKLSREATDIGDGLHGTPAYVDESDYHFVNGNNLSNGSIEISENTRCVSEAEYVRHRIDLNEYSILISINGTIGNLALYHGERVMLGKSAAYVNCGTKLLREFLFWYLQSSFISRHFEFTVTGTTIFNLSLESLRRTPLPLPGASEQQQIIEYLSILTNNLERMVSEAERAIELLQERRTALISAAVTGKIDVRGLAPTEAAV